MGREDVQKKTIDGYRKTWPGEIRRSNWQGTVHNQEEEVENSVSGVNDFWKTMNNYYILQFTIIVDKVNLP